MKRLETTFQRCREEGRKGLVMFVSAGDPDLPTTERLVRRIVAEGADIVEIGVPFSDPMADGPTIQAASQRALASGTTLDGILEMTARLRRDLETPLVLFSYYNVLFKYGFERLAADASRAGADALLIVDIPYEERDEVLPALQREGLDLITLVAPTTSPDRAEEMLARATGFVYCITVTGVTGARQELPADLSDLLRRMQSASPVPVAAGFGISTPEMARSVAAYADAVVVGSALIKHMEKARTPAEGIEACGRFVRQLAEALENVLDPGDSDFLTRRKLS